jgi:hypothetical protein
MICGLVIIALAVLLFLLDAVVEGIVALVVGAAMFIPGAWSTIGLLKDYPKNLEKWEKEYRESDRRLRRPVYARSLKNAGIDVPDRYLK